MYLLMLCGKSYSPSASSTHLLAVSPLAMVDEYILHELCNTNVAEELGPLYPRDYDRPSNIL